MTKVTLDMSSFKALASDTRLNILKSLDGKKMNLKEICKSTDLNKATLHEHLIKLSEAGLVKRIERQGHKWVYYKLTWKGEGLLHPENTRIVVLFSLTFISLAAGIIQFIRYLTMRVSNKFSPNSLNHYGFSDLANEFSNNTITPSENLSSIKLSLDNGGVNSFYSEGMDRIDVPIIQSLKEKLPIGNNWNANTTVNTTADKNIIDNGANFATQQSSTLANDPMILYIAITCFIIFISILCIAVWRYRKNKTPKL